ncbi:hypothetical protein PHYBOEH_011331 [Phytophthora boehmeriae]|uniref:Uncharacterized protein n=1 Tax=Phytophthora boehmeriae TaxID=109152 RepID=A0A8T1VHK0_9STRA|nr:hypothetical protein PHYBOEH_011331 [Phytophthora boehmeriae]
MQADLFDELPEVPSDLFAFVDDVCSSLDSTATAELSLTESGVAVVETSPRPQSQKTKRRMGRNSTVAYSTDHYRRRKAELQTLTAEAKRLNAQLVQLVYSRQGRTDSEMLLELQTAQEDRRRWRGLATIEYEGRMRARTTNQRLKAVQLKQLKVLNSIRKVLCQDGVLEGMKFVERLNPMADSSFFHLDYSDHVLAELSSKLKQQRMDVQARLPNVDEGVAVALRSRTKHQGSCFETNVITSLACTADQAGVLLWNFYTNKNMKDIRDSFRFIRAKSPRGWEESNKGCCIVSILIQNQKGDLLPVEAVSAYHKYEEVDSIAVVGTTSWFLPTEELRFIDRYWTAVSRLPSDPEHSSLIRTHYELQVESAGAKSNSSLQEMMIHSIGQRTRKYLQLQQDAFLDEANPAVISTAVS